MQARDKSGKLAHAWSILEQHDAGVQAAGANATADRSVAQSAAYLEEAWAWGFDVDVWRAHLNPLTWPEVCVRTL